jgi:hypothetical protein
MPYLDKPQIYYPELRDKKYDAVKAKILKMYVKSLEEAYYPMDIIYPNRR